jgi:thioredoxin-related protein
MADIDMSKHRNLIKQYGITGYPTFLLYKKGTLITTYQGSRKEQYISYNILNYIQYTLLTFIYK